MILDTMCAAILEHNKKSQKSMVKDEELLEIRGCQSEEILFDLRNWPKLNKSPKQGVT